MEEFDLKQGVKKYVKEAQWVIPSLSLSVVAIFISFLWFSIVWMSGGEITLPFVFIGIFAVLSGLLFLRYRKNSKKYYFFCYIDAYPDMDAPLNVLIYADYRGRLADEAREFGLTDLTAEFIRTRQVYHLDVRATAPNGDLMSASFETGKATVHNLTTGTTTEKNYTDILSDRTNSVSTIEDCILFIVACSQTDETQV